MDFRLFSGTEDILQEKYKAEQILQKIALFCGLLFLPTLFIVLYFAIPTESEKICIIIHSLIVL